MDCTLDDRSALHRERFDPTAHQDMSNPVDTFRPGCAQALATYPLRPCLRSPGSIGGATTKPDLGTAFTCRTAVHTPSGMTRCHVRVQTSMEHLGIEASRRPRLSTPTDLRHRPPQARLHVTDYGYAITDKTTHTNRDRRSITESLTVTPPPAEPASPPDVSTRREPRRHSTIISNRPFRRHGRLLTYS